MSNNHGINTVDDEKLATAHREELPQDDHDLEQGKGKSTVNNQLDDAARLLAEAGGHVEYTEAENKRVLRKIDIYVCIPMCLIYFIQQVSNKFED